MILGIESSSDYLSIAIVKNGRVLKQQGHPVERKHSEQIGNLILELAGSHRSDICAVAISGGPGSYTGLRIGSSAAKGLCYGLDIDLISVNSLLSTAYTFLRTQKELRTPVLSVMPSRRGEVYLSIIDSLDNLSGDPTSRAIAIDDIPAWLQSHSFEKVVVVGPGSKLVQEILEGSSFSTEFIGDVTSSAENVALLGEIRFNEGLLEDLESYEPDYLKPFVAKQGTPIFERLEQNRNRDSQKG